MGHTDEFAASLLIVQQAACLAWVKKYHW